MFQVTDVAYIRAQAMADGDLVDVSRMAGEAGIRHPVALTRAVWDSYVMVDAATEGQDEAGRLWDILWMFRCAARGFDGDQLTFQLYVNIPHAGDWRSNEAVPERDTGLTRETHRRVTLKAVCGPGDTAAPVITIMTPDED